MPLIIIFLPSPHQLNDIFGYAAGMLQSLYHVQPPLSGLRETDVSDLQIDRKKNISLHILQVFYDRQVWNKFT